MSQSVVLTVKGRAGEGARVSTSPCIHLGLYVFSGELPLNPGWLSTAGEVGEGRRKRRGGERRKETGGAHLGCLSGGEAELSAGKRGSSN